MVGYPNTELILMEETGETILAQKNTDEGVSKQTEHTTRMLESDVISSTKCDDTQVRFKNTKEENRIYAECQYLVFQNDNVAYIEWLEVDKDLQGNDIGRTLRGEMVNEIGEDKTIYSHITHTGLISVALNQGFRKIRKGRLGGWFVRSP